MLLVPLRTLLSVLLFVMPVTWLSCTTTTQSSMPVRPGALVPLPVRLGAWSAADDSPQTLVLVALDGVRWRDVFHGVEPERALAHGMQDSEILDATALVPNLHSLAAQGAAIGARGAGMVASGPNFLSVPGYMEMLSGRTFTGCTSNGCGRIQTSTIADQFAALPDTSPSDVAVIASWEGVGRAAAKHPEELTISVGRTSGRTRHRLRFDRVARALLVAGEHAGPEPGSANFRRDRETSAIALHYLRARRPRFLFLGLGETDEYGHRNDYRGYLRALTYADYVIGRIAAILSSFEAEGRRTTLIVTTDHGRAYDFVGHGARAPESAEIWMVAAGWGIRPQGNVTPTERITLADVAATIRRLGGLPDGEASSDPIPEILAPPPAELAHLE